MTWLFDFNLLQPAPVPWDMTCVLFSSKFNLNQQIFWASAQLIFLKLGSEVESKAIKAELDIDILSAEDKQTNGSVVRKIHRPLCECQSFGH